MSKYVPLTKELVQVIPVVRDSDNIVIEWEIHFTISYEGSDANSWPQDTIQYMHVHDVESLSKTKTQFTKAELLGFVGDTHDHVFEAQYDQIHFPSGNTGSTSTEEFNLDDMPD